MRPHRWQPTRLPRPWDSPGKNTGVGCHFLLQCVKVKSLSRVRPSVTPWSAAFQAPPSMGFSRQEYWSGVPLPVFSYCPLFPLLLCCAKSLQLCLTLCDPMDCSPPSSSVHGFSRQEYWNRLPCPPPGDLPDPGIKPMPLTSPTWQARSLPLGPPVKPLLPLT